MDKKFMNKMDNMELDMVAGGSIEEVVGDFDHLRELGITGYKYSRKEAAFYWGSSDWGVAKNLEKQWNKVGIRCVTKPLAGNTYEYNGKSITRNEAFAIARNFVNSQKK